MEVDDVVMRAGDDETSTGWCFAVTSLCAVVGSTGSLLLDSESGEHLCTPKFADLIPTGTAVTDELMDGVDIKESHASSSVQPGRRRKRSIWK